MQNFQSIQDKTDYVTISIPRFPKIMKMQKQSDYQNSKTSNISKNSTNKYSLNSSKRYTQCKSKHQQKRSQNNTYHASPTNPNISTKQAFRKNQKKQPASPKLPNIPKHPEIPQTPKFAQLSLGCLVKA